MITSSGVNELSIPANELFTLLSIAIANRNAGNKLPKRPVNAISQSLFCGTSRMCFSAKGRKIMPAEKMRIAAICQPFNSLLLNFIRINELPQIKESSRKIIQLINLYFDISAAKVQ